MGSDCIGSWSLLIFLLYNGTSENWDLLLSPCRYFDKSFTEMFRSSPLPNVRILSKPRPVEFLEKKLVTTRAMTICEQGARAACTQRKTESGNTSLLLTSLVKWSTKLIGTLCSARIIINVSAIVIPWPVFECDSTLKKALVPNHLGAEMIWWRNVPLPHLFPFVYVFQNTLIIVP